MTFFQQLGYVYQPPGTFEGNESMGNPYSGNYSGSFSQVP